MITIPDIRVATRADRHALRALQETSMRELALAYYEADVIEAFIAEVGTLDETLIDDGTYLAMFVDGALAGCGGWSARVPSYMSRVAGDPAKPLRPAATVRSIYVHPAFARRGLARRLMARVEAEIAAAGFDRTSLAATLSGLPLYRRIGYRSAEPVVMSLPGDLKLITVRMHKRFAHARVREAAA